MYYAFVNPLSVNPTKWSNTLKQFVSKLPTNFLNVFDHFVKLALKGLTADIKKFNKSTGMRYKWDKVFKNGPSKICGR